MSLAKLEAITRSAVGAYTASVNDSLPDVLKADRRLFGKLQAALSEFGAEVNPKDGVKLVERREEPAAAGARAGAAPRQVWAMADGNLAQADGARLERIAVLWLRVLEEASQPNVMDALVREDQGFFLNGLYDSEVALADFDYTTPGNPTLRSAVGRDEAPGVVKRVETYEEIPMERLHDVARASLDLLDATRQARVKLADTRALFQIDGAFAELREKLRDAAYLVPGESSARRQPYAEQTPRGTREELQAILGAAGSLRETVGDLDKLMDVAGRNREGDALKDQLELRMGLTQLGTKYILFGEALAAAQPQRFERVVEERTGPIFGRSDAFPKDAAEAVARALDAAEQIHTTAQIDTLEPNYVTYKAGLHKEAGEALKAIGDAKAAERLGSAANGFIDIPGLTAAQAKLVQTTLDELRGFVQFADKRGVAARAVTMEDMDRFAQNVDLITTNGAYTAIASHAERAGFDKSGLIEGRGVAAFATAGEAMGGGRGVRPDQMASPMGRAMPEMSLSQFRKLPEGERARSRAFVIEPGKVEYDMAPKLDEAGKPVVENGKTVIVQVPRDTLFSGYESNATHDSRAAKYRQARLRDHIRGKLKNADGSPNFAVRALLIGLSRRAIVAPNLDEAQALRQMSDKLIEERRQELENIRAAQIAKADKLVLTLDGEDVRRFVRSFEASGSDEPATLVKRGQEITLEHPEARDVAAKSDGLGALEGQRKEVYRLGKIDVAELKAANDPTRSPLVFIQLENDRPARIASTPEAFRPQERQERRDRAAAL